MSAPIVVVGATGALGGTICRLLRDSGHDVRGLVRPDASSEKRERLTGIGAQISSGDLERPGTLPDALAGVEVVISTASSFPHDPRPDAIALVDRDGQLALVEAAVTAGVRRLVYVSFPPLPRAFPFQDAKRAVEQRLCDAALEHVILQPSLFMDVWFTAPLGFDLDAGTVRLYGDGSAPQRWVAVSDVAAVAVAAATGAAGGRVTVPFGGPEELTQREVVERFERALGRRLVCEPMPARAIDALREAATTPTEASLAAILWGATQPEVAPAHPLATTTVAAFAARSTGLARGWETV